MTTKMKKVKSTKKAKVKKNKKSKRLRTIRVCAYVGMGEHKRKNVTLVRSLIGRFERVGTCRRPKARAGHEVANIFSVARFVLFRPARSLALHAATECDTFMIACN